MNETTWCPWWLKSLPWLQRSAIRLTVRLNGGFTADADQGIAIAQVQVVDVKDHQRVARFESGRAPARSTRKSEPNMVARGGGAHGIELRSFTEPYDMLVVHLLVDCVDAMGANAVNTMAEGIAPLVEDITGGRAFTYPQ